MRWAAPLKTVDVPDGCDGRRRVGVREVKGEMTCVVTGKGKDKIGRTEGVVMNVEYKGTCKGVWFPGVATLLGMDVGLEAKGSDVAWVSGAETKWSAGGGLGYTGFDVGPPPHTISRQSSIESPQIYVLPSSPGARPGPSPVASSRNSASSTSSLLRAPLPVQNVGEYSFEGSMASSTPSGTISSIGSLPPSSIPNISGRNRAQSIDGTDSNTDSNIRPPAVPITIHVNMNDLLPPSKNLFTFTISGTILVIPRPRSHTLNSRNSSPTQSDCESDPEPLVLPRFSVLAADAETTTTVIRNEVDGSNVEVYNSAGDIRDAQTRKTVLQKGGFTRCGADGGRITLRSVRAIASLRVNRDDITDNGRPPSRPRTPNGISRASSPSSRRQMHPASRPRRDGPLMIPSVVATVTPLLNGDGAPNAYAVHVCLPAPSDADSEWLEFGLAQPSPSSSTAALADGYADPKPPHVEIASASVEGVPVRFETTAAVKQVAGLGVPFEELSGKEWVSWVRVHVGSMGGGMVVVDYIVKDQDGGMLEGSKRTKKGKDIDGSHLNIFLPTFSLPVGRLEVNIETNSGSLKSVLLLISLLKLAHRSRNFNLAVQLGISAVVI